MKNFFIFLAIVLLGTSLQAQTVKFFEDFETLPLNVSSSGTSTWDRSSALQYSGSYCDTATFINIGDSAILTTDAIDITGYSNILLDFQHICKTEFFDGGYIELSNDNGVTWSRLTDSIYLGEGQFGNLGHRFSSTSYALDWEASDYGAIPTNDWWKNEKFDLSAYSGSYTQLKIRFVLKDNNNTGAIGNYGWLIDDIKLLVSNTELNPPSITLVQPILKDSAFGTGPFTVSAQIIDNSGIDTAMIEYTVNGISDTVPMTTVTGNLYKGSIPSYIYGTTISYKVIAKDASLNNNITVTGSKSFYNVEEPMIVNIGSGTFSAYNSPIYNGGISDLKNQSSHISIVKASELGGYYGLIDKLSLFKSDNHGYGVADAELTIYLKHTNAISVPSDSAGFYAEFTGATLVYSSTTDSIPSLAGKISFDLNAGNFSYNGVSNIMVMIEWYRPSALVENFIPFFYDNEPGLSKTFYGTLYRDAFSSVIGRRPNMELGFSRIAVNYDVAMDTIINPQPIVLIGNSPVNIRIKNSGDSNLVKATVNWSVDNISQPTQIWNGDLQYGLVSNDINIGNYNFTQGPHNLKIWASSPNDNPDEEAANDTINLDIYSCTSILNGYYTIGGTSADFNTMSDAMDALTNCGINGPVTLALNTGIYNEQLYFNNSISGMDSINTITLTSVSGNPADVLFEYSTSSTSFKSVIILDNISYFNIKDIHIKNTSASSSSAIKCINGGSHILIDNCILETPKGDYNAVFPILMNDGNIHHISIINSKIIGGYYAMYIMAKNTSVNKYIIVKDNIILDYYRYGLYLNNGRSSIVTGNYITNYYDPTFSGAVTGLYINSSGLTKIEENELITKTDGASYGVYIYGSDGELQSPTTFINNISIVKGNSTSTSYRALYIYATSYIEVYNNTITTYSGSNTSEALFINNLGEVSVSIKNNICANKGGGYAMESYSGLPSISSMDYNSYYTSGSLLAKFDGLVVSKNGGISDLRIATSMDTNSLMTPPLFYSIDNARSFSAVLQSSATPILGLTHDIDGKTRSLTNPSIGAYEFGVAPIDAGVTILINPLQTDTQNRVTDVRFIVKNYGTNTQTAMDIKYSLNGGAPINYAWSGTLASTEIDTISIPAFTVPVLDYSLKVYTDLSGDTNNFNDTASFLYYGLPLIDASVNTLISPADGCNKTNETVNLLIENTGVNDITSGLTASYQILGSSTVISESVTDTIPAGSSINFEFSQTVDMLPGAIDSTYTFIMAVNHSNDPLAINDSLIVTALSMAPLAIPLINDTTINYGNTVTLVASSQYPIVWFENDSSTNVLSSTASYTTPMLYDTTDYWLQSNTNIPASEAIIGTSSNAFSGWDNTIYSGGGSLGRYQIIYSASDLISAGLIAGEVNSVSFQTTNTFNAPQGAFIIKLAHSNASTLTTTFEAGVFTEVYNEVFVGTSGWNTHSFTTPFIWDGTSGILINICASGIGFFAEPVQYTTTTGNTYLAVAGMGTSCSSPTGMVDNRRPNTRFTTPATLGCSSIRTSVIVNVPLPQYDATVGAILAPIDNCGLDQAEVAISIINRGTDTLASGYTATYKINNGTFISPEVINTDLAPGDTLDFYFTTLANLSPGANGQKYIIGAKVINAVDTYSPNDTLSSDSILSKYTPINPTVVGQTINYSESVILTGTANDTLFWYADSLASQRIAIGTPFISAPLYDTTIFWVNSQRYINNNVYQIGNGSNINMSGPSPYGAGPSNGSYGSRHQFLIRASELHSMGIIQGYIKSIAFDVAVVKANVLKNYTVKFGSTNYSSLSTTVFDSTLTTVSAPANYTEVFGWNTHTFNTPYYWDGISNIIIETCFKGTTYVPFAGVNSINTPFVSSANSIANSSFNCNGKYIANVYSNRPNIRIEQEGFGLCQSDALPVVVNVINFPTIDASISSISIPTDSVQSCSTYPIEVTITNFGLNNLTYATINWSEDGELQTPYTWTGNLSNGQSEDIIINPTYSFDGGTTEINSWVSTTGDTITNNDTATIISTISMSGSYSIGLANVDYNSLNEAIDDLNLCGICGPVVFNVDSGNYNEHIILANIRGNNSINGITFQSTNGDSNNVNIIYATTQNSNYVFHLNDIENVTFKNLSLTASGAQYGNVFVLENNTKNISIENNIIVSTSIGGSSTNASAVSIDNFIVRDIFFDNNIVMNGYKVFNLYSNTAGKIKNIRITNNTLVNNFGYGVYAHHVDSLYILNNTITTNGLISTSYGLYIYNSNNVFDISNNTFELSAINTNQGLYIKAKGNPSTRGLISNNSIAIIDGSGSNQGIYLNDCEYTDLVYNSVNIITGSGTGVKALNIYNGSDLIINNNNFSVEQGYVLYCNGYPYSELDYNNFYVGPSSPKFVKWLGSDVLDLTTLQALDLTKNSHTKGDNPFYYSNSDLHSMQNTLYNSGIAFTRVPNDLEGNIRSTTAPSIGAYEFTPTAIDLSAQALVHPFENSCDFIANDSIIINIRNFGLNNISFSSTPATITVEIDGINPDTLTYTINSGSLASGADMDYTVSSSYNMTANGNYIFNANIAISNDGNAINDAIQEVNYISFPTISSFPFIEDFESGENVSFLPHSDIDSKVTINAFAASTGTNGLQLEGGNYANWNSGSNTVDIAFSNTTHVSKAISCNVDASSLNSLKLKIDLKQTANSNYNVNTTSWFRVMLTDANGTHYLSNLNGDTVFHPATTNLDPFISHVFSLDNYVGQSFSIAFEAANKYKYGTNSSDGDNALIDNITFWEPTSIDLGINSVVQGNNFGPIGNSANVNIALENFGIDTLHIIPLAYHVNNGTIIRDTFYTSLSPSERDTFTFAQPFTLTAGIINVTAFGEYVGDVVPANDTATAYYKGLATVITNYSTDFEGYDDWIGQGSYGQWELGMPTTANIDTTHSGVNAYVTRLNSNYINPSEEFLYTPYITIPAYTDTVTLDFWHKMRMVANKAYGTLEYSFDGNLWASIGYIGMPNSTFWYNSIINGLHVWSRSDNSWINSTIKLDPTTFNTGNAVQFRFKFVTTPNISDDEGWAIDDFKIYFPSLQKDAGVVEIINPTDSSQIGTTQIIKVKIKNFGTDTIFSTDVRYTVGTTIVTETFNGAIPRDSVIEFTFAQAYTINAATDNICVTTLLSNDMQTINDNLCKSIVATMADNDAGVSSIHAPYGQTTIGAETVVKVYITNYGVNPITLCEVQYTISGNPIIETFNGNIASGDSAEYVFTTTYASLTGAYSLCAKTELANDGEASNDTKCIQVVGTGIENVSGDQFIVIQNQPNPAQNKTTVDYYLPKAGTVNITLVNVLGKTIINDEYSRTQGMHQWNIDVRKLESGVYYYTVNFDEQTYTYKMMIIK